MSLIKIFSPAGWDFGVPVAGHVKVAHDGLRGHDRREFLKRASHTFLPILDRIKIAKDEEPVHLIAVGADERWGGNRNGDAFKAAECEAWHHTFEKFARWYRNHKNKDTAKSYGIVKASAWNPVMHRIELLVALNREKSAAERNGGLVADREMEKLSRGEDIPVSMACRVEHDVCSYCGNKARNRGEYCKEATCKAGGCADNLARLIKVAGVTHHLRVFNPRPGFFDISDVFKPAERTAYASGADYLKAAADNDGFFGIGGSKMAEDLGVMAPLAVILGQQSDPDVAEQLKLAYALADFESLPSLLPPRAMTMAFAPEIRTAAEVSLSGSREKIGETLAALAADQVVLPIDEFARATQRSGLAKAAAASLPGAVQRIIDAGDLDRVLADNAYRPSKEASAEAAFVSRKIRDAYSVSQGAVERRLHKAAVAKASIRTKEAAAMEISPEAEALTRDYVAYKVATLQYMAKAGCDLLHAAGAIWAQDQSV